MYSQKCIDLRLVSSAPARKGFTEQFFDSICRKSVHFSGLGPGCALLLVDLLCRLPRFVFIDLSYNRRGDNGLIVFSEFLSSDPPIVCLDLRSNKAGVDDSHSLFRALASNTHFTDLGLSAVGGTERHKTGTDGCSALSAELVANERPLRLNVAFCGITTAAGGHRERYAHVPRFDREPLPVRRLQRTFPNRRQPHKLILSPTGIDGSASERIGDFPSIKHCRRCRDRSLDVTATRAGAPVAGEAFHRRERDRRVNNVLSVLAMRNNGRCAAGGARENTIACTISDSTHS
jgi:hypothetical protein